MNSVSLPLLTGLLAAAIAIVQIVRGRRASGAGLPRVLAILAAAWLAGALVHGAGALRSGIDFACGIAGWTCLTRLAFHRLRGRSLFIVTPFTIALLVGLGSSGSTMYLEMLFAWPALARSRWAADVSPRVAGLAALGALALALATILTPHGAVPGPPPVWGEPARFGAWSRWVCGCCALVMVPGLVRRWSLGLGRVQSRLLVLIALAGYVPPVLIGGLWATSTLLGTNADRSGRAMRWLDAESEALRAALVDAMVTPGDPAAALRAVAGTRASRWPELRVWHQRPNAVVRVYGAAIRDSAQLGTWPEADTSGLALLDGGAWIVASHPDSVRGTRALALVPLDSLALARMSAAARAEVRVTPFGVPDSATAARRPTGLRIVMEDEGVEGRDQIQPFHGYSPAGIATPSDTGWVNRFAVVSARTSLPRLTSELWVGVRDNPLNLVPLFVIGLLAAALLVTMFGLAGMVRALGRSITTAVSALRGGAAALEQGRLDHRIEVTGRDDLWDVAAAFNRMAEGLERGRRIEAERRRLEDEMDLARRIQERLLPQEPPRLAGYDLAGTTVPARHVGGDYYDFVPLGEQRVALVIADVSGKGVAAGLLMSAFRAALQTQPLDGAPLRDVVARINAFLHRSVEPGRFVTAFLAVLDARDGALAYINAGHNAPMLQHAGGAIERLEAGGPVLGILPEWPWVEGAARLERGDRLVLFTDGVTEAQDPSGALWEDDGLLGSLARHRAASARTTLEGVIADVRAFEAGAPPTDDVTLLIARRDA